MKRIFSRLAAVGAAAVLALGCSSALAAEDAAPVVGVQLDGTTLTFTDAVPQVKDQRTFLPFRAVFEALGAEVDYKDNVVTATRNGRTITMTLGSTQATITENGVTTPLAMDVAPYVDNATWRTYVPVRFAAQALDCAVGWDQGAYTAIIVDTDALVDQAAQGKSFTYLEKFNNFSKKYSEGIWDCDLTMDGSMSMLGLNMPLSVTAQGATEGTSKVEMAMNMKLDMTQFAAMTEQDAGEAGVPDAQATAEELAMLESMKTDGLDLQVRGDLNKGMLYMNMAGAALESAGLDPNAWYSMDMNALLAGTGMDMSQLIKQGGGMDYEAIAKAFLNTLTLNEVSGEGYGVSYEVFKSSAENLVLALSDAGFIQDGDKYVSSIDGGQNKMELALTMKDGAVTAYDMIVNMTISEQGMAASVLVDMGVDEKDQMRGKMQMTSSMAQDGLAIPLINMDLTISGGYAKGATAPVTEPPAGAAIVDMTDPEQVNGILGIMPLE